MPWEQPPQKYQLQEVAGDQDYQNGEDAEKDRRQRYFPEAQEEQAWAKRADDVNREIHGALFMDLIHNLHILLYDV